MTTRADVMITADELMGRLAAGEPVAVLDVRWQLSEPDGRVAYLQGHIPGAVYVSLEDELTDHTVAGRGRHPLPSGPAVAAAARRWGLRQGHPVVVYDDWNRAGSARAWWVLTAAGLRDVRILDGGLAAWRSAGGALDTADDSAPALCRKEAGTTRWALCPEGPGHAVHAGPVTAGDSAAFVDGGVCGHSQDGDRRLLPREAAGDRAALSGKENA